MSELHWIDHEVLARHRGPVVKRADAEQLHTAAALLARARAAEASAEARIRARVLEAQAAGHAAGIAQGREAWARELAERQVARLARVVELHDVLADVVMQSLRHLLAELPAEQRLQQLVQRLLADATAARRVRLVVSPADEAAARSVAARWHAGQTGVQAVEVIGDESLQPGDCLLETDEGAIDGRLDERLALLEAALSRRLREAAA